MSNENTQGGAEPSPASAGSVASPLELVIRGTLWLHELIEAGSGDSDEADAVRDAMDAPWKTLGNSEREAAMMMSAAIRDRKWIPVAERLPDVRQCVLGYSGEWGSSIAVLQYFGGKDPWIDSEGFIAEPTHWMPIPAHPTSDK